MMITYGRGGWIWSDLYHNIPIYLRNYYYNELLKTINAEKEHIEKATTQSKNKRIKR